MPRNKDINDIRKEIINSFNEYLRTKNNKLIKKYSKKNLLMVLNIMEPYSNEAWYQEIKGRLNKINEWREKIFWRILVSFVIAVLSGLSVTYLKGCLSNAHAQNSEETFKKTSEYYEKGMYEEAIIELNKIIERNPKISKAYIQRGSVYIKNGKFDQAISDFSRAIAIEPNDNNAYFFRGLANSLKKQYNEALFDYNVVIKRLPLIAYQAYYFRGNIYQEQNNFDQAIADYKETIQINPNFTEAHNALASALDSRGLTYLEKGDLDKAISDYTEAIKINPNEISYYKGRGFAYNQKGDLDKSFSDYNKAIELNPSEAVAYFNRGSIYEDRGDFNSAIADYSKAIKINPDESIYYTSRASAYWDKGNFDQVISDYSIAIRINPRDPIAYRGRGLVYLMKNDYGRALEDMKMAKELGSNVPPEMLERIKKVVDIDKEIQYHQDRKEQVQLNQRRLEIIGQYFSNIAVQQQQKEMIRYQAEQQARYNRIYNPKEINTEISDINRYQKKRYKMHYDFDGSGATIEEQ
jgi:tetratricopeptide (TPR) repeat protein